MSSSNDNSNSNNQNDPDHLSTIPHERPEARPDFSKRPYPKTKLPTSLTRTLSSDEKMSELLDAPDVSDSEPGNERYAAYAARVRTILRSAHRYVAYTSDIGESFRPVAHPFLVSGAYAVSWAYLVGDVGFEGYKAFKRQNALVHRAETASLLTATPAKTSSNPGEEPTKTEDENQTVSSTVSAMGVQLFKPRPSFINVEQDYRFIAAERAVFQSLASMALPAFTIHSIVRYSGRAMKNVKYPVIRTWGPIGLGLGFVPFLPYIFDEPIEHGVKWVFHRGAAALAGGAGMMIPRRRRNCKLDKRWRRWCWRCVW